MHAEMFAMRRRDERVKRFEFDRCRRWRLRSFRIVRLDVLDADRRAFLVIEDDGHRLVNDAADAMQVGLPRRRPVRLAQLCAYGRAGPLACLMRERTCTSMPSTNGGPGVRTCKRLCAKSAPKARVSGERARCGIRFEERKEFFRRRRLPPPLLMQTERRPLRRCLRGHGDVVPSVRSSAPA